MRSVWVLFCLRADNEAPREIYYQELLSRRTRRKDGTGGRDGHFAHTELVITDYKLHRSLCVTGKWRADSITYVEFNYVFALLKCVSSVRLRGSSFNQSLEEHVSKQQLFPTCHLQKATANFPHSWSQPQLSIKWNSLAAKTNAETVVYHWAGWKATYLLMLSLIQRCCLQRMLHLASRSQLDCVAKFHSSLANDPHYARLQAYAQRSGYVMTRHDKT
jgi:hypothetical protein